MRFFKLIQRSLREFSFLCYLSLMISVAIDRTRKKIITPVLYTQKKINPTKTHPKCEPKKKKKKKEASRKAAGAAPGAGPMRRARGGFGEQRLGEQNPADAGGWQPAPRGEGRLFPAGWGEGTPFNI